MEASAKASPGDCQALDLTKKSTTTINNNPDPNPHRSGQQQRATSSVNHSENVRSTTATATGQPLMTTVHVASSTNNNNNNNNNKLKSQHQQQQQQQNATTTIKFHQFRAPQQFVKHNRATSMLANGKKNKTWNKRQNKCHLHKQQQQQQAAGNSLPAGGAGLAAAVGGGSLPATKADLENIQNNKNQLGNGGGAGGGHHHHQYYHHHHHGGGHHGGRGGGNTANGIGSCLCNLEKLGYGHGHLKQPLYKKMLAHRGHHHHVLCPGAVHNASGGGNSVCCLANGCTVQNGKDSINLNSHNNSSHPNVTHYCCARSKFFLPEQRPRKEVIIPPTKFLLGGTISDPLNLNSLQNECASNNNTPATTPRQSPITTPPKVEVIIPPNIHDPLHLLDPVDSMEYEKQLTSPMKRRTKPFVKKYRNRKNRKPKHRPYESYNSSTLDDDALLLSGGAVLSSSLLNNSPVPSELASTVVNSPMVISLLSPESSENTTATTVGVGVDGEERIGDCDDLPLRELMLSSSAADELERQNTAVGSPRRNQQHVAASLGETSEVQASLLMNVRRSSERERVSKDLRLDLNVCGVVGGGVVGGGGVCINNNNSSSINNSASNSTCGSIATLGSGGGGRKRKISESNNSLKSKKYHRLDAMDKIVSPVVPQPGAWKRPPRLVPSGGRKPSRRSTSVSENELLSPADEGAKLVIDCDSIRGDTPDMSKMESVSEVAVGSPHSTASGGTSGAAGEQDSIPDSNMGDVAPASEENTATMSASRPNTQVFPMPKFRPYGVKYQYGNFVCYSGLRYLTEFMDVRLQVFQHHAELFANKDILDIGCNVGHITINVAHSLKPKSIVGIDIDNKLIEYARRNLSMYVRIPSEPKAKQELKEGKESSYAVYNRRFPRRKGKRKKYNQLYQRQFKFPAHAHHAHFHHHYHHLLHHHHYYAPDMFSLFPVAFPICLGGIPETVFPVATPCTSGSTPGNATTSGAAKSRTEFPRNISFQQYNYVPKDEAQLNNDTQQYDLIICLSVTKWIHLNFGDNGLKLAFKRMFNQLRPGGKLILEAQNWASYKKKKNLTERIYKNYHNIEFFPNKFHEYLLSTDVGFSHSYTLGVPRHLNKGFSRPIQLYAKGDYTPNHVRWSDAYYPETPYEAYRGIYATMPPRPHPTMFSSRSQNYDTPHHLETSGGGGAGSGARGSSSSYSLRQTPMHQPTSQYYNPLETDSYLPSYDMEYLNHLYVFASPLYQTIWSPPASLRNSSTHTPLYGSVRESDLDGDAGSSGGAGGSYPRHVYPPNEDTSSPNASAGGAFNSIRDPDTDDSNQLPGNCVQHVYATNCESSSSPQVLHAHESLEPIDETLMLAYVSDEVVATDPNNCCGYSSEA